MGKYDYNDTPIVNINYKVAIKQLNAFINEKDTKSNLYKQHLRRALKKASLKLVNYQIDKKVNMQKVELLRDVIFVGTSLIEETNNNHIYYRAVIAASLDIIEKNLNISFTDDFIKKLTTSKNAYLLNSNFNTIAFYFMFKSHFRYTTNIKQ